MLRMQQEDFRALLQECLDRVTPEQQAMAARRNNRAFIHQVMGDMIEWRLAREAEGLADGVEREDFESDDEGLAASEVRWPPEGDPHPSDQLAPSLASQSHSVRVQSPRSQA